MRATATRKRLWSTCQKAVDQNECFGILGRKADWSEVAPRNASCILQRPLDVVPRSISTGPSGQPEHEQLDVSFGSPWRFLLPSECANASVSCKLAWKVLAEWTPIGEQYLASIGSEAEQGPTKELLHNGAQTPEEFDADDLEHIYQTALQECPNNPEQRFQQLLDERYEQEMRALSS